MSDVTPDRSLLARIRAGDESALAAVIDAHGEAIARVIGGTWRGILRPDAEEVMAEVLMDCWKQASDVDLDRGTLRAWLAMRAKYRTLDHLREHRRRRTLVERLMQRAQEPAFVPEYTTDLDASLAGLSETERRLAYLRFIEGRPVSEIALVLGLLPRRRHLGASTGSARGCERHCWISPFKRSFPMSDQLDDVLTVDKRIATALRDSLEPDASAASFGRAAVLAKARASIQGGSVAGGRLTRPPARRLALATAAGLALAVALAAFGLDRMATSPSAGPIRYVDISLAWSYGSLAELARDSDLVVIGTVTADTATSADPQTPSIPQTRFRVTVDEALKGSALGGSIVVVQTGGKGDQGLVLVRDDPLMTPGDHVALFLRRVDSAGEPVFAIVGGPQGRFIVQGDTVVPLPAGMPQRAPLTTTDLARAVGP